MLNTDASKMGDFVAAKVKVDLNQPQFDSLVSFTFNVGTRDFGGSTVLRQLNSGQYGSVPDQMMRWTKAGGQVLPGLINRRSAEGMLFSIGTYSETCGREEE